MGVVGILGAGDEAEVCNQSVVHSWVRGYDIGFALTLYLTMHSFFHCR